MKFVSISYTFTFSHSLTTLKSNARFFGKILALVFRPVQEDETGMSPPSFTLYGLDILMEVHYIFLFYSDTVKSINFGCCFIEIWTKCKIGVSLKNDTWLWLQCENTFGMVGFRVNVGSYKLRYKFLGNYQFVEVQVH